MSLRWEISWRKKVCGTSPKENEVCISAKREGERRRKGRAWKEKGKGSGPAVKESVWGRLDSPGVDWTVFRWRML